MKFCESFAKCCLVMTSPMSKWQHFWPVAKNFYDMSTTCCVSHVVSARFLVSRNASCTIKHNIECNFPYPAICHISWCYWYYRMSCHSYSHKDTTLCKSYTIYGHWKPNEEHDLCIGGLPALFKPPLPNPRSYNPTWDKTNIEPTDQAIIYWLNLPNGKQLPVILMYCHFT